jgi:DNA-binding transcriptional LysR family regulator
MRPTKAAPPGRPGPAVNVTPLEQLWAVAPAADGLSPAQPVRFADVAGRPIVMPTPGHGLHALITTGARQAGSEIDVVVQTNSMSLQQQLVRCGHGWTILPAVGIAGDLDAGTLSAAPLCAPEVWRSIVLGMPRTGRVPAAVEIVARELVQRIRSSVRNGRWPSAQLQNGS